MNLKIEKTLENSIKMDEELKSNVNYKAKAENLLNDIIAFKNEKYGANKSHNLIDIILDYCYHKDLEPEEVGDILSEHKEFKSIIETNAKKYNFIQIEDKIKENDINEDEW